jgi:hypothetical protein
VGIDSYPGSEGEAGGASILQLLESLKPWQILLIAIAVAVIAGILVGVNVGKHQLKKASGHYKPLLSLKQRLVYISLFALGAACVLFGVFYDFSASQEVPDSGILDEGVIDPGLMGDMGDGGVIDPGLIDGAIEDEDPAIDEPEGDAPADDAPVDDAPADDAPVDDAPAEEDAPDDTAEPTDEGEDDTSRDMIGLPAGEAVPVPLPISPRLN